MATPGRVLPLRDASFYNSYPWEARRGDRFLCCPEDSPIFFYTPASACEWRRPLIRLKVQPSTAFIHVSGTQPRECASPSRPGNTGDTLPTGACTRCSLVIRCGGLKLTARGSLPQLSWLGIKSIFKLLT